MNIFFDTSVLVAASERGHPHYPQAISALRRVATGLDHGFMSAHSIAELYAVLTRLPVRPRIHPAEATRIIHENLLPHFELITLRKHDYLQAIEFMSTGGWSGAGIYDLLLLLSAGRCPVQRVYTFNVTDFRRLAPADLLPKNCAPSE